MTVSLVQRIAQHLIAEGVANTTQIAQALEEPAERVGDAIRHERNRNRWGIQKLGPDPRISGRAVTLWSIDPARYAACAAGYRTPRAPVVVQVPKLPSLRQPPPIPDSPFKTMWQPTSPYWSAK